jgi:hypothetical protein
MRSKKVLFPSFPGLTGESRKSLKALDPPVKPGDDDIINIITFRKDPFIMPIYKAKFYYSAFIPALKSGVFC